MGRVADVANGSNRDGITFQRFVLAALLDDVLGAASGRLHIMSSGRFHLQRVRERSDRRTAAGLDLEVHDHYTGTARPVSTLSGGESFLASLSLALGLADVVQTYSGGIQLDAVFVDEGFGSLDPEALDLALQALVDLQGEGRLVGIISHVPALQEIIDARLEVTRHRSGSTARFVIGCSREN
jgi:DNA repair protein SbcC/Rad50